MIIDIALGITLIIGFLYGYSKGLIKTIFSLLSILLGIIAAMKLSPFAIRALETTMPNSPRLAYIMGFLLTFILVIVLIRFIGNKLESLFKMAKINFINKSAGGIILAFFFGLLFSTVIWFLNEARLLSETQKDQSFTYYHIEGVPAKAREEMEVIKPVFREFWDKTIETFDKAKQKGNEIQQDNIDE